ncbi:hypothetical protein F5887DRAFT_1107623, partial [Amanita rubescens]
ADGLPESGIIEGLSLWFTFLRTIIEAASALVSGCDLVNARARTPVVNKRRRFFLAY